MSGPNKKEAYPNYDQFMTSKPVRDTRKWVESVKNMYFMIHKGMGKAEAFDKITLGWSDMEKMDFTQWLKFYEQNSHKKYSEEEAKSLYVQSQVSYWQDNNRPGYFVPMTENPGSEIESAQDPATNKKALEAEKRELIERQRSKILSRLDSAEKLIRSQDGQTFAGKEFEALLHIIYELKKKIQTVNKISLSSKIYEDLIVREANVLMRSGHANASNFLVKLAQEMPVPAEPAAPQAGAGLPGNLPGEGPGMIPPPSNSVPSMVEEPIKQEEVIPEGMKKFLEGLDSNNLTYDDDLEVNDAEDVELVVEAQAAPPAPAKPKPVAPAPPAGGEVKPEIEVKEEVSSVKDFDNLVDRAFENLTVGDVVDKLVDLAKIFKVREVPRQLAMIDMMLDHLGLASLFPSLAEAMNKSLDSNQYIASRIEDILSRLQGTMHSRDIDLKSENVSDDPQAQQIKKKLEDDDNKDKERKKIRKEQADAEVDNAINPPEQPAEIEVEEDLSQPAAMKTELPPKAPAKPPAPLPQ
jgi:hypothetical protein